MLWVPKDSLFRTNIWLYQSNLIISRVMEVAFRISKLFDISIDDLAKKDLQKYDILLQADASLAEEPDYKNRYLETQKRLEEKIQNLERLNKLQEQRMTELEWMIKKHAPSLAREIGLLKN